MPKKNVKPLFAVKHDFVDSLDRFCETAVVLHQAVSTALELGQIGDNVRPVIEEKLQAFERAMMTTED